VGPRAGDCRDGQASDSPLADRSGWKTGGIVSLGDVARYEDQKHIVAKSLQAISEPAGVSSLERLGRGGALTAVAALALAAVATTVLAWLAWNHSGQALRKQISESEVYHTAWDAMSAARDKVDEAASSKQMRDLRRDMGTKINDLSAHLPTLEYRPARRKHVWFA